MEDAPAPNALNKFDVFEKNGGVYIKGEEAAIRAGQRDPVGKRSVTSQDRVVVIGGYVRCILYRKYRQADNPSGSGTLGLIQAIRELNFPGSVTIISREPNLIIDRTKLSKALITDVNKILWRPKEWYDAAAIETVSDEVTGVDFGCKSVATKSGQTIPYTKLVLATGGIPKTLPMPGFNELDNIFLLRFVTDAQAIVDAVGSKGKKIVVIGSSFIGMEIGNCLAKENDVTIVGQEPAPMARIMGETVGRIFQRNLEKANGVTFHLSAAVDKAVSSSADPSKVGAVHLKDGTVLPADLVVLGTGVRPATDFLRDNPAVTLEKDGSLRTDERFAVPGLNDDVFAIGDIATFPYHGPGTDPEHGSPTRIEHWNVAQNAGRGVARTIVDTLSPPASPPTSPPASPSRKKMAYKSFVPIFWSALGAQLRYCGNTPRGYDDIVLHGEPDNAKFVAYYCKGQVVVAVATMGMDPVMSKCAELMRRRNMPLKADIEKGVDVLRVEVPAVVKM